MFQKIPRGIISASTPERPRSHPRNQRCNRVLRLFVAHQLYLRTELNSDGKVHSQPPNSRAKGAAVTIASVGENDS